MGKAFSSFLIQPACSPSIPALWDSSFLTSISITVVFLFSSEFSNRVSEVQIVLKLKFSGRCSWIPHPPVPSPSKYYDYKCARPCSFLWNLFNLSLLCSHARLLSFSLSLLKCLQINCYSVTPQVNMLQSRFPVLFLHNSLCIFLTVSCNVVWIQ